MLRSTVHILYSAVLLGTSKTNHLPNPRRMVQISLAKIPSVFGTPEVRARNGPIAIWRAPPSTLREQQAMQGRLHYKHKHKGIRLVFRKHTVRISEALTALIRSHLAEDSGCRSSLMDDRCNRYSAWRTQPFGLSTPDMEEMAEITVFPYYVWNWLVDLAQFWNRRFFFFLLLKLVCWVYLLTGPLDDASRCYSLLYTPPVLSIFSNCLVVTT